MSTAFVGWVILATVIFVGVAWFLRGILRGHGELYLKVDRRITWMIYVLPGVASIVFGVIALNVEHPNGFLIAHYSSFVVLVLMTTYLGIRVRLMAND